MGRGGHNRINGNVTDYKNLDVQLFQHEGKLAEEGSGYYKSYWKDKRTGDSLGNILIYTTTEYIKLFYTIRDSETGYKQDYSYKVTIEWTPCNYGGKRAWFICSKCGRRVRKLYLRSGYFHCRRCQQLNYYSQQQSKSDQKLDGIREKIYYIQKQLKAVLLDHNRFWIPRPKGMHYRRYKQLINKMHELQQEHELAFRSEINRKLKVKQNY